jgi:chromosome segregation ATPase
VAERRGIVLPGVMDEGQLWKALKALIPVHEGGDLVTLLEETEKLRKDVRTKDALLVDNEERLHEVNSQKKELEQKHSDTLTELENQKIMLEQEKLKAQKALREKEAELRKLRAERASKDEIESKEIEIMYLKKRLQQHQQQERELVTKIVDLQQQLETNDIGKLEWIASNLEKQLEGVRPEFERERSQMMNNIYKMLKYIKIPDELMGDEEEEGKSGKSPELPAAEDGARENVRVEDAEGAEEDTGNFEDDAAQQTTPV